MKAFLDTHAAAVLAEGDISRFGRASADLIGEAALFVSPAVRLELTLLREIARIRLWGEEVLGILRTTLGVVESVDPFAAVVSAAIPLAWVRDPFDRLIVGTAALHRAPLITRDRNITEHFPLAVW